MSLYKRGNVWWSRIEWRKTLIQRSTKCRNINDARQVESVWKSDLAKGEVGIYRAPTLLAFSDQFINYLPSRVAKRTLGFYVDAWMPLIRSPLKDVRIDQIDGIKIEAFIQARLKKVSITTVNHSLRTLRRALHLAEEWKLIPRAPKISLLRGEKGREFVLTEDHLSGMLKLCEETELGQTWPFKARRFHPEMRSVLPFLIDTGLRAGEICRLDWPDVDLTRGTILVKKGKSKYARRHIPLTRRAKQILSVLPRYATTDAVFTRNGRRVTVTWMSHQFTAMRRRLNLPDGAVLHSCRHTFCSRLGERGASPFDIQRLAGHASIMQSQKYVHPGAAQLEAAVRLLEPQP